MSKSITFLGAFAIVAAVSACGKKAPQEEYVVVAPQPEPISYEPVYTGKYK